MHPHRLTQVTNGRKTLVVYRDGSWFVCGRLSDPVVTVQREALRGNIVQPGHGSDFPMGAIRI
jgi:hypothetical protein